MEPLEFLYQNQEIELSPADAKTLQYSNIVIGILAVLAIIAMVVMK